MTYIQRHATAAEAAIRHNLGLYRLHKFSGRRRELLRLQSWLLDSEAHPTGALAGPAGVGKSTLATAAAWSVIQHFPDGVMWVAPAGQEHFRLYDVAQTLDAVLGTAITRQSQDMWKTSLLALLWQRRRLLVLDETDTATPAVWESLLDIFGHLEPGNTSSRILILTEKVTPDLEALADSRIFTLRGFTARETRSLLEHHGPSLVDPQTAWRLTDGNPLALQFLQSLPIPATDMSHLTTPDPATRVQALAHRALAQCAVEHPEARALLARLTTAAGGASLTAVRDLFWQGTLLPAPVEAQAIPQPVTRLDGLPAPLRSLLQILLARGLLEQDAPKFRVVIHPVVRGLLSPRGDLDDTDWRLTHTRFYVRYVSRYETLDLEHWSEVDPEWGNVRQGADWCVHFMRRCSGQNPLDLLAALPVQVDTVPRVTASREELRLVIQYAQALALHAFWRHPPHSLDWIAAGAVACVSVADFVGFGRLLLHLGRQHYFRRDFDQALFWLERARAVFAHRDMLVQLAYVHTDLGMVYRALGQHAVALRHCQRAFEYLAQGGEPAELGNAYLNLGSVYASLQQYEPALHQYRNGLRLASRLDDRHLMANTYNNLGLVLEARGQRDTARAVYIRALELYQFLKHGEGESTVLNNLGSVLFLEDNAAAAETWYRQALARCAQRGAWLDMAATHHNLGLVLQRQQRWTDAAREFEAGLTLYRFFQLDAYAREEEALWHQCQEARGTA